MDFAKIMEVLENHNVSLISVTQQFNTTTSMGRLTLNILLSFAQFEREIISERTRDKTAAARRRGKWTGGPPVLGYDRVRDVRGPRLDVNPEEAQQVQAIFKKYLETGSLITTVRWLNKLGCANCAAITALHPTDEMALQHDLTYGRPCLLPKPPTPSFPFSIASIVTLVHVHQASASITKITRISTRRSTRRTSLFESGN